MSRYGITKALEKEIKPEKVFDAAQVAFKQLGWEVYKMRSIAFLVEARITGDEGLILANVIVTVFGNSEIKITLKSDTASQETVVKHTENIMAALEGAIAAKK